MQSEKVINALTIDVEDYFQVSAFAPHIPRSDWPARECRVERNVDRILLMLDQHGVKATFFALGWLAERYPEVIRRIVAEGHELASHGYGHERASDQTDAAFFADINLAKLILEDLAGQEVKGYRAPSFSIGAKNLWAFDCLERAGYRYSSSIYPIRHDHYGMPEAPRHAHVIGGLLEIPATTLPEPQLASERWRLFPFDALWTVALDAAPSQSLRPASRGFLFPSVGNRFRTAPYSGD